jgi:hypothetical protein
MFRETSRRKAGKRQIRFPGISTDAAILKVDRVHLWKVLVGDRVSHSLLKRWKELQVQKKKEKAITE